MLIFTPAIVGSSFQIGEMSSIQPVSSEKSRAVPFAAYVDGFGDPPPVPVTPEAHVARLTALRAQTP